MFPGLWGLLRTEGLLLHRQSLLCGGRAVDQGGGEWYLPHGRYEALSTNELIALMCRALERKPHIWKINRGLMEFCARFGTLLHLPLNEERLRKLTENYVVSNAKIKAAWVLTECR